MEYRKNFNDYLAFGRIAEGAIAQWLVRAKGYSILPAYEIEIPSGKGPRLLTRTSELVAPDLYGIKVEHEQVLVRRWIEAKHKERFTWHRNSKNWQTGIDLRHYEDYWRVRCETRTKVYILFLHRCKTPSRDDIANGSPSECPVGLFCGELGYLREHVHHKDEYINCRGRAYPMVYWNHQSLTWLASLEEVNAIIPTDRGVA